MLFNSAEFFCFLLVMLVVYWALSARKTAQNAFLLLGSWFFYFWADWRFGFLLVATVVVSRWATTRITALTATEQRAAARRILYLGIGFNLLVLGFFKYFDFFTASVCALIGVDPQPFCLKLLVPVGVSFYTFMAMGAIWDAWRQVPTPRSSWLEYALFISFFPQLLAGPIGRAGALLPQIAAPRRWDGDKFAAGVELFALGLFKKLVVADRLMYFVNNVWDTPAYRNSFSVALAICFFSIQIYCDFSGYTDMARGCAKLFGIELAPNFDLPYFSRSVGEFWRRWHISLSSWFRDYLYIPLGGSRVGFGKYARNVMTVFLASGLWHGANWTFVIWGGIHGFAVVSEKLIYRRKEQLPGGWGARLWATGQVIVTFVVVAVAWVFFRGESLSAAGQFFGSAAPGGAFDWSQLYAGLGTSNLIICFVAMALLTGLDIFQRHLAGATWRRVLFWVVVLSAIVFLGVPAGGKFIYSQF